MKKTLLGPLVVLSTLALSTVGHAQHLWWDLGGQKDAKCLYGEVTVWATGTAIYYCGANWHPGEPAGGYCGIQHNSETEKRTIFSIWDTTAELHPTTTFADKDTIQNRFGGEGEGGHTHMIWPWKVGETFRFFLRKKPGIKPNTTDCEYFVFEPRKRKWLHSATITNPNGGHASVETIGGSIGSFLENFSGQNKDVAKLATYNLWLGPDADHLTRLTGARGDGKWGQLGDAYFLAEGSDASLEVAIRASRGRAGVLSWGGKSSILPALAARPVPRQSWPLP